MPGKILKGISDPQIQFPRRIVSASNSGFDAVIAPLEPHRIAISASLFFSGFSARNYTVAAFALRQTEP
jgi:hypothetical protein